jgi:hypothetical protein
MADPQTAPRLRVGVVVDHLPLARWQAETLRLLEEGGDAVLEVVATMNALDGRATTTPAVRSRSLLDRVVGRSVPRSLQPASDIPWPDTMPVIEADPADNGASTIVEALAAHRLDVLLNFSSRLRWEDATQVAARGIWSFVHGSGSATWPIGTREISRRRPVIAARLIARRAGDGAPTNLREGWFQVAPESRSRTCDRVLLGSSRWPALACREIRLAGTLPARPLDDTPRNAGDPMARDAAAFTVATVGAIARRLWHHGMRHDDWNIGVVDAPISSLVSRSQPPEVNWAPVQRGHYAADPYGRWNGDELEVFYEDFLHARDAASIARRIWRRDGGWGDPAGGLDVGTHLSYPFLIDHDGQRFMLPESRASGSLVLYREEAPGGPWVPHATLDVSGDVGDATIVRHEGHWWLFGVGPDRLNPATELMVWYADQLEGPWTPHPLNPVVVDVRSARPGGPFFTADGVLYRPAQDCSTGYGDRVAIKRINLLTPERVDEEVVSWLDPERDGPFPYGLHTLTGVGDVTLVDGKRRIWDTAATVLRIRRRLHH